MGVFNVSRFINGDENYSYHLYKEKPVGHQERRSQRMSSLYLCERAQPMTSGQGHFSTRGAHLACCLLVGKLLNVLLYDEIINIYLIFSYIHLSISIDINYKHSYIVMLIKNMLFLNNSTSIKNTKTYAFLDIPFNL